MPSSTPIYQLPFPLPNEPFRAGAVNMRLLAEKIEATWQQSGQPPAGSDLLDLIARMNALENALGGVRIRTGVVPIPSIVGGTASAVVPLPAGVFTVAPIVVTNTLATDVSTYPSGATPTTTTSTTIRVSDRRTSGSSVTLNVQWIAVQA